MPSKQKEYPYKGVPKKIKKITTYVLSVSQRFPTTHKKKGEPTGFVPKIYMNKTIGNLDIDYLGEDEKRIIQEATKSYWMFVKRHTIRGNYDLWKKRIAKVEKGEAIISIRIWSDKPYKSKQIEVFQLSNKNGVGIQQIQLSKEMLKNPNSLFYSHTLNEVALNDGLDYKDFYDWFDGYDFTEPMAIIHFTPFRY
jgi:hypothetical protein